MKSWCRRPMRSEVEGDEGTPKERVGAGKKRYSDSAAKSFAPAKKAKATPQKFGKSVVPVEKELEEPHNSNAVQDLLFSVLPASAMEYWAVEVKSGEKLTVVPDDGRIVHISQACLGESEVKKKKRSEPVNLFVKLDGMKSVLGTLFPDKLPQQKYDLAFERDFRDSPMTGNMEVFTFMDISLENRR